MVLLSYLGGLDVGDGVRLFGGGFRSVVGEWCGCGLCWVDGDWVFATGLCRSLYRVGLPSWLRGGGRVWVVCVGVGDVLSRVGFVDVGGVWLCLYNWLLVRFLVGGGFVDFVGVGRVSRCFSSVWVGRWLVCWPRTFLRFGVWWLGECCRRFRGGDWWGGVRGLRSCIRYLAYCCEGVGARDLVAELRRLHGCVRYLSPGSEVAHVLGRVSSICEYLCEVLGLGREVLRDVRSLFSR